MYFGGFPACEKLVRFDGFREVLGTCQLVWPENLLKTSFAMLGDNKTNLFLLGKVGSPTKPAVFINSITIIIILIH